MQYAIPIQSAGGRHHPVARRLIILAALISADVGSEQATKAMFGKVRQRLWVVVNLQVGDMPRKQLRRRFSVGVQFMLGDKGFFDVLYLYRYIIISEFFEG